MSHSRIFQISKKKIDKENYIEEERYYDSFLGEIADSIEKSCDERGSDLEYLARTLGDAAIVKGDKLIVVDKEHYLKGFYEEFKKAAKAIADATLEDFCTTKLSFDEYHLRSMYNDKFDIYMDDNGEEGYGNQTLMNFLRRVKNGDVFYIGGIMDYHY